MSKLAIWTQARALAWLLVWGPAVMAYAEEPTLRPTPERLRGEFDGISPELFQPILYPWLWSFEANGVDVDSITPEGGPIEDARRQRARQVQISPELRKRLDNQLKQLGAGIADH